MGAIIKDLLIPVSTNNTLKERFIRINNFPDKVIYHTGDKLILKGLKIEAINMDGSIRILSDDEYTTIPVEGETLNSSMKEVIVNYITTDGVNIPLSIPITVNGNIAFFPSSNMKDIKKFLNECEDGYLNIKDYWKVGECRYFKFSDSSENINNLYNNNKFDRNMKFVVVDLDNTTSGGTKYNAMICTDFVFANYTIAAYNKNLLLSWLKKFEIYFANYLPELYDLIKPSDHMYTNRDTLELDKLENMKIMIPSSFEIFGKLTKENIKEANVCHQFEYFKNKENRGLKQTSSGEVDSLYNTVGYLTRSIVINNGSALNYTVYVNNNYLEPENVGNGTTANIRIMFCI